MQWLHYGPLILMYVDPSNPFHCRYCQADTFFFWLLEHILFKCKWHRLHHPPCFCLNPSVKARANVNTVCTGQAERPSCPHDAYRHVCPPTAVLPYQRGSYPFVRMLLQLQKVALSVHGGGAFENPPLCSGTDWCCFRAKYTWDRSNVVNDSLSITIVPPNTFT